MTLEDALIAMARFAYEDGFDETAAIAFLKSSENGAHVVDHLREAVVTGGLSPALWRAVTMGSKPADPTVALAALWDAIVDHDLTKPAIGRPTRMSPDALRFWAYTRRWLLFDQDEDLFLMDEDVIPALLEVATERDCSKRGEILEIVAHWARDSASAAVGTPQFRDVATRVAQYESSAHRAGAEELAGYLRRLGTYAVSATVHADDALQRGRDLTRCRQPPDAQL
jgi:hypothetical protein